MVDFCLRITLDYLEATNIKSLWVEREFFKPMHLTQSVLINMFQDKVKLKSELTAHVSPSQVEG